MTPNLNTEARAIKTKVTPPAFTKSAGNNDNNEFATGSKYDIDPTVDVPVEGANIGLNNSDRAASTTAARTPEKAASAADRTSTASAEATNHTDATDASTSDHDPKVDSIARWKDLAMNNEKILGKMVEFSHLIEKSGKQLETMGQKLYQIGNQVEQYFSKHEKH